MENNQKLYDAFFSYAHKDRAYANGIIRSLQYRGISVWQDNQISFETDWIEQVAQAIRSSRYFITLISENSLVSENARNELMYACQLAENRSKTILPILLGEPELPVSMRMILGRSQRVRLSESDDIERVADDIAAVIKGNKDENVLYEKLSEYMRAGAHGYAARVLADLAQLKCEELLERDRRDSFGELILLLESLQEEWEKELSQSVTEEKIHVDFEALTSRLKKVAHIVYKWSTKDLYCTSLLLHLICYTRGFLSYGGLSEDYDRLKNVLALEDAAMEQYRLLKNEQDVTETKEAGYPANEWKFILQTPSFVQNYTASMQKPTANISLQSDEDTLLLAVAEYMQKGNDLFEIIGKKDTAQDFLQCLILSYERLKAYCGVVGEPKIAAQCIDRISELKQIAENAKPESTGEKARTGIRTLLGLTVPKSGKFDVFISHKKEDADIASDMYHFLQKNLKEAFFDKYSLPEMSDSQYRKSIMQALDGSSHFVVVFSDLAYLDSYWVDLEMTVFQSEMDEGRKPHANFILVATDEVYDEIMKSNKTVLPIAYRRNEIMRVRDYKTSLLQYISK